jgi:hypothetical protein
MAKDYLISPNKFWDLWFQKFFSQVISIKVWVMLGSALLRIFGYITGTEMVTLFVTTLGIKGAYEIVDVFRSKKLAAGQEPVVDDEQTATEDIQRRLNR